MMKKSDWRQIGLKCKPFLPPHPTGRRGSRRLTAATAFEGKRCGRLLASHPRRGSHVVSMLHVHLVFVTKRRGKVFSVTHLQRLEEIFRSVCADFEVALQEFNGERQHVHLVVTYPPKFRLSELVNSLKGVSSRLLKREFPAISAFWSVRKSKGYLWSPSYFTSSVGGAPLSILRQYIEAQTGLSARSDPPA
jgi:putative transposase